MFEWTKWRIEYLTTPSLTNHSAVLMLKVLHQTSIAWGWGQILNFWHLNHHHLNVREFVLLKDLDKKRIGQVWYCVVSTATKTIQLIRAWSIFNTWGDTSESVCGDLGKTGEWWEGCPCSDSSSGAPVEEIPLKMLIPSIYCFERLPLASWGCRTCSSRRASWPAGSRGAPADCSPVCHLSSPRPTWSAQPPSRSTQLPLTTLSRPIPSDKSCRPGFEACGRSVQPLLLGCLHCCCHLYCQPV